MTGSACLVVAGPSGVGKSTLIQGALAANPQWVFSVSATTREPRAGEVDGREYYFLSQAEFEQRINRSEFLEYAEVYGHFYGTPRAELERAAAAGKNLLIEVDSVGCLSIRAVKPEIPLLAVLPPSLGELKRRLSARGTESPESLKLRFAQIVAELARMRAFDFCIVNDNLAQAQAQLLSLLAVLEQGQWRVTQRVDRLLSEAGGVL